MGIAACKSGCTTRGYECVKAGHLCGQGSHHSDWKTINMSITEGQFYSRDCVMTCLIIIQTSFVLDAIITIVDEQKSDKSESETNQCVHVKFCHPLKPLYFYILSIS